MGNLKIELNKKAVGDLLHSQGLADVMLEAAHGIQQNAGNGYEVVQKPTRAIVRPKTDEAARDNLENNTLLKAVR